MKYDKSSTRNTTTVIRLKADNFDCYVSEAAYREITLQMSSGDFGAHKKREIQVSPDTLENIKYHYKVGFVDFNYSSGDSGHDWLYSWYYYDGTGDCIIEPQTA